MASVFGDDDEFAKVLKRAAKPAPSPVRKPTRGGGKAAARAAQPKMYKVAASVTLSPEPGEEIPDDEVDLAVPTVVSQPPPVVAAAYKPPKVQAPKVSKFAPRTSPMNSALVQGDAAPEQPSHPTDPDPPSVVEDEAGERVVSNAEKEGFEVRVRLCNGVVPFDAAGGSTITLAPKPEDEDEEGDDDDSPMSSRDNYV